MARIWKDRSRRYGTRNLLPYETLRVRVCSFTFRFEDADELRRCLAYFEQKVRPSSRVPLTEIRKIRCGRWCSERWFERLPMYLLEEPKGQKVVGALKQALGLIDSGKLALAPRQTPPQAHHHA
jgi:hypothetical protein